MKNKNKGWTTAYNEGVFEGVCIHGIGHSGYQHSCDGCCVNKKYTCPFCKREVPNKENIYCEKCI